MTLSRCLIHVGLMAALVAGLPLVNFSYADSQNGYNSSSDRPHGSHPEMGHADADHPEIDRPEIVMSAPIAPDEAGEYARHLFTQIYVEAFDRLGYNFVYRAYPNKRARALVNQQALDGELARFAPYSDFFPGFVRVEEPILPARLVAYSANPEISLSGWQSLIDSDFRVEFLHDSILVGQRLQAMVARNKAQPVNSIQQGIIRLLDGRSDVFVSMEFVVDKVINNAAFEGASLHLAGEMEMTAVHAFFGEHRKDLAEPLAQVLKQMKREGLFQQYDALAADASRSR